MNTALVPEVIAREVCTLVVNYGQPIHGVQKERLILSDDDARMTIDDLSRTVLAPAVIRMTEAPAARSRELQHPAGAVNASIMLYRGCQCMVVPVYDAINDTTGFDIMAEYKPEEAAP